MIKSAVARRVLWVIVRYRACRMEVLTVDLGSDGEMLPVFGFEEEAGMYHRFELPGEGWKVRRTSPGELASMLCDTFSRVEKVALDPLPAVCGEGMVGPVVFGRKEFVNILLGEKEDPAPAGSLSREERPLVGSSA